MISISYKKLRDTIEDRDITLTQIRKATGLSKGTMSRIGKDEPMSILSLAIIAKYLNLQIYEIVDIIFDKE